jgi:hypothetical protein
VNNRVCKALLQAYGDPNFHRGTKFTLERRLDKLVKGMGAEPPPSGREQNVRSRAADMRKPTFG